MPTLRIPLVGSYTNRAAGATDDQIFTNCFPEVVTNSVTGKRTPKLLKRLGYNNGGALTGVASALTYGAIAAWTGATSTTPPVVGAFLNTGGTSTSVWNLPEGTKIGGDIANTSGCSVLDETMVSATPTLVGNFYDSSTGVLERWYFPEGGAWTQVTDSDFPASTVVGRPAFMDGWTFDMTSDGKVVGSDLNSVSLYTATNFISANTYPDKGVTVARHGHYILAFGEGTIEVLRNNGNPTGSPLSRETTIPIGAYRHNSFTSGEHLQTVLPAFGTVYFIASSPSGAAIGIYRLRGLEPEKISSVAIDNLLENQKVTGFVGSMFMSGIRHVVLRGSGGVWAFCLETNFWWKVLLASGEMRACVAASNLLTPTRAITYFLGTNNARANAISGNQDDGVDFTQTVTTEEMDLGTEKVKFYRRMRADYDRQSSTSNLGVSWSDNGGSSFSTARNIDMSVVGVGLASLGASRRRIWKFTNTANTPSGIKAIELEYDVGAH